jgi:hypothetical protein
MRQLFMMLVLLTAYMDSSEAAIAANASNYKDIGFVAS